MSVNSWGAANTWAESGVILNATLGSIVYTSSNPTVELLSSIDLTATLGLIDYSSNNVGVTLSGSYDIISTLGAIIYNSNNAIVQLGAGQYIGTVSVSFKPNEITVSFKD